MYKPALPQGMRDFTANTIRKRNFIFNTIRKTFEVYGFEPLETPAMENLETLLGKYGEEGDRLIFKVLNNGINDPKNAEKAKSGFEKILQGKSSADLTERALKYDLTIPFARHVAMHHGEMVFPYKRYQMQNVWRADRPQKGRYREFTQCDVDVVGSNSLLNEIELLNIYHDVFTQLHLHNYSLHINNRKILAGLSELTQGSLVDLTVAIDKIDKIGQEKVADELRKKQFSETNISLIKNYLAITGSNSAVLHALQDFFPSNSIAQDGINDCKFLCEKLKGINIVCNQSLARGLNYYTGSIFEAKAPINVNMGSIGGGGRYDDLTGLFGVKGIPGVGISFGVDRIYDVMEELNLFPSQLSQGTTALFLNMGTEEVNYTYEIMQQLRKSGIDCDIYPENTKMDKQMKYAHKKNIVYAIIIGSKEIENKTAVVKNLKNGEQTSISITSLTSFIKKSQ